MNREPDRAAFHRNLRRWYTREARDFPWRRTRDPYLILCSEIMLQQTQADRVAQLLPVFLKKFPTATALAKAKRSDVIRAWQGMGYNRRAVHLHEACKTLTTLQSFARDERTLRALPGIGRYTAAAIACFAFEQCVAVVDVNIRRVLSRISKRRVRFDDVLGDRAAWDVAAKFLPRSNCYTWNQALMELGARICKARSAACGDCPMSRLCPSSHSLRAARRSTPKLTKVKREPCHKGIPNRIWRGKIIELLRGGTVREISSLGKAIDAEFRTADLPWLTALVERLVHDGLVRTGTRITLA